MSLNCNWNSNSDRHRTTQISCAATGHSHRGLIEMKGRNKGKYLSQGFIWEKSYHPDTLEQTRTRFCRQVRTKKFYYLPKPNSWVLKNHPDAGKYLSISKAGERKNDYFSIEIIAFTNSRGDAYVQLMGVFGKFRNSSFFNLTRVIFLPLEHTIVWNFANQFRASYFISR